MGDGKLQTPAFSEAPVFKLRWVGLIRVRRLFFDIRTAARRLIMRAHFMPEGVQYPDLIDKVIQEKDGEVVLVMREDRPWDGSPERLVELRKKINTYAAFARQGQLVANYPDLAGKPVSFQLLCIQHRPDPKTIEFLDQANAQLAVHSLQIRVRVIEVVTSDVRRRELQETGKPWWKIW